MFEQLSVSQQDEVKAHIAVGNYAGVEHIFGLPPGTFIKILGPILLQILQGLGKGTTTP